MFSNFEDYLPNLKIREEGGGVLLLVNKKWKDNYENVTFPKENSDEIVGIHIKTQSQKLDVYCIYVPPNKHLNKITLNFIKERKKEFILAGDLNAIMPDLNGRYNASGKILERQILEHNLVVLNNNKKPTS